MNCTENNQPKPTRLGDAQRSCLERLAEGSAWRYGGINGWLWDTPSGTRNILDKLVSYGLVECVNGNYSITEYGMSYLKNEGRKVSRSNE